MAMTTLFNITSSSSSPPLFSIPPAPLLSPYRLNPSLKTRTSRSTVEIRVNCSQKPSREPESEEASETETDIWSTTSASWSSISTYSLCAGIGGLGFLETAYLTYLKLTDSDAFCPIGGGTCGDILNGDYAVVFGVPLPLIGMAAYGLVAALGLQLARKSLPSVISEISARLILLGTATSMAAASAYFLYIIHTNFPGASCSYCLISAFLSFSLLFATIKDFGLEEIQNVAVAQLCIAGLVFAALSTSYGTLQPVSTRSVCGVSITMFFTGTLLTILGNSQLSSLRGCLAEIDLKPFATEITTESSPFTISLAKHLRSIGAKMYGAFWCSHCVEQKQMFGSEAAKILDYVECFPNGYKKGVKIAKACSEVGIEGFPTWVINGEVLSGEKELEELAQITGFNLQVPTQPE